MSVYVDNMQASFGQMIMCHMMADTTSELLQMVDRIGVMRKWIQKENAYNEHFDIAKSKRRLAIQFGAIEISMQDLVRRMQDKR